MDSGVSVMAVMQIIIPTLARTDQQITLSFLPAELRKRTTLVCPKREASKLYRLYDDVEIFCQPDPTWKIAPKREWIMRTWLELGYDKIIMLDDDLTFSTRTSAGDWHLRQIEGEELIPEFQRIEDKLGPECPHVGFGSRQGNNWQDAGWKSPGRMIYALAYYLPIVVRECEFNRVRTHEDIDITLQLLRKGYPNAIWNTTVVDQKEFNAFGGTSIERTVTSNNEDAYRLAELHPGYVSVRWRKYKVSVQRQEVHCLWQKALRDGRSQSSNTGLSKNIY
jgi:hypothetical protein